MIQDITSESEVLACFPLMQQLRPHLHSAEEWLDRWRSQSSEGYRLIGDYVGNIAVALAGYRVQQNLVYGRFLYVDDLVTDSSLRSAGHGQMLMDFLKSQTKRLECQRLVLDTPLSNVLGHRFYYRQGLLATSLRFGLTTPT